MDSSQTLTTRPFERPVQEYKRSTCDVFSKGPTDARAIARCADRVPRVIAVARLGMHIAAQRQQLP